MLFVFPPSRRNSFPPDTGGNTQGMEADASTALRKLPSLVTVPCQEIKAVVIQSNLSGSFSIVLFGNDSKISFTSFSPYTEILLFKVFVDSLLNNH